jgi:hypothetical protein
MSIRTGQQANIGSHFVMPANDCAAALLEPDAHARDHGLRQPGAARDTGSISDAEVFQPMEGSHRHRSGQGSVCHVLRFAGGLSMTTIRSWGRDGSHAD